MRIVNWLSQGFSLRSDHLLRTIVFIHSVYFCLYSNLKNMDNAVTNPAYYPNGVYAITPQYRDLQGQVDQVTEIMRHNVQLGLDRGENLDALEMKAEDLNYSSQLFAKTGQQIRKKYWWKNVKMWILLSVVIVIILVLVIVLPILAANNKI